MRRLRSAAVYLALIALMMRALVPVGWMPSAATAADLALVPCPMMDGMHGMLQRTAEPQHPAKRQVPPSHEGSICPFATVAQPVGALEPHQIETARPQFALFSHAGSNPLANWDHVPRAPPPLA